MSLEIFMFAGICWIPFEVFVKMAFWTSVVVSSLASSPSPVCASCVYPDNFLHISITGAMWHHNIGVLQF